VNDKPQECAGCEVGMRTRNGIHIDKDGVVFMTCEKEREINRRWNEFAEEQMRRIPIL
jgi:hypothetical protein